MFDVVFVFSQNFFALLEGKEDSHFASILWMNNYRQSFFYYKEFICKQDNNHSDRNEITPK